MSKAGKGQGEARAARRLLVVDLSVIYEFMIAFSVYITVITRKVYKSVYL